MKEEKLQYPYNKDTEDYRERGKRDRERAKRD